MMNGQVRLILIWGRRVLGGLIVVMAVASYLAYTTIGFDFEHETARGVDVVYYRLRWDDGACWVGRAVQPVGRPNRKLDWFDPGGTILASPSRPVHPHWWNRWGFWWITDAAGDPYVALRYPGAVASVWFAVPSWLVVLVIWAPEAGRLGRKYRGARPGQGRSVGLLDSASGLLTMNFTHFFSLAAILAASHAAEGRPGTHWRTVRVGT